MLGLREPSLAHLIDARITRVRAGNFGDHKHVGGGVFELRIARGPGFRIYYGLARGNVVILLGGGDKGSQRRDIAQARKLWRAHQELE